MPTGEPTTVPRAQRPFQFTLRQLLAATGAVCVLAAGFYWTGPALGMVALVPLGSIAVAVYFASKRQFTEAAFSIFFGLLLPAMLLPAIAGPRVTTRGMHCNHNLHILALALQNYHDLYGSLPPAYIADDDGKPMHSWRVLLLPFLDMRNLYRDYHFDEPWDGPNNSALAAKVRTIRYFECPAAGSTDETSYVAVTGPQTMWPGAKATKLSDIKDGTSNTIILVEVHNSGIHWMEPRDLDMSELAMAVNSPAGHSIASGHKGGWAHVVFANGQTRAIDSTASPKAIRAALTIAGGEKEVLPARKGRR